MAIIWMSLFNCSVCQASYIAPFITDKSAWIKFEIFPRPYTFSEPISCVIVNYRESFFLFFSPLTVTCSFGWNPLGILGIPIERNIGHRLTTYPNSSRFYCDNFRSIILNRLGTFINSLKAKKFSEIIF